jgi:hypothetical protein
MARIGESDPRKRETSPSPKGSVIIYVPESGSRKEKTLRFREGSATIERGRLVLARQERESLTHERLQRLGVHPRSELRENALCFDRAIS